MSDHRPSGSFEETQPYYPAQQSPPTLEPEPLAPPARGCSIGCVLWGCLGTTLTLCLILGLLGFAGYRFYQNQIAKYTSPTPLELPSADITEEEVEAVVTRLEDFREQFDQGEAPQEIIITVDEINALIANNPELRGRVYVSIVDGNLKADVSIPVDQLPGGKGRYFNGSITMHVEMEDGVLIAFVQDAEANGQPIPEQFMQGFRDQNIAKELYKDVEMSKTLKRCEELIVESDRIILRVKPLERPASPDDSADSTDPSQVQEQAENEAGDETVDEQSEESELRPEVESPAELNSDAEGGVSDSNEGDAPESDAGPKSENGNSE